MKNDIIEQNDGDENELVSIGGNDQVNMQLLQSIYHELTGKTEKISKSLRGDHVINFEDIRQLNIKISQLKEQYSIKFENCSVTLYHIDDCKQQFSSFEKFEQYDSSGISPCENVRLVYDFLIVLPQTREAQPYKIEIDLTSRIALRKKANSEHGIPRRMIRIFASRTGKVDIKFVDYAVARSFMVAIEHWYDSIHKNESTFWRKSIQDNSEYFPVAFKFLTSLFVLSIFYFFHGKSLQGETDLNSLFLLSLVAFGCVFLSSMAAERLGRICEHAVDSHQSVSGLKLNRGDSKAVSEHETFNQNNNFKVIISIFFMVLINVFSTILAGWVGVAS